MTLPSRVAAAGPDRGALARWLGSSEVVTPEGGVRSWANPRHPGFPYPEAAALWLAWAAWRRSRGEPHPEAAQIRRVGRRLLDDLAGGRGVGKDGATYLFDTCLAVAALLRADAAGLLLPLTAPDRLGLVDALGGFLRADRPVLGAVADTPRWSTTWGRHLGRASALLTRAAHEAGDGAALELARRVAERVAEARDVEPSTYSHAHLYALEGAHLAAGAAADVGGDLRRLAALQHATGGLPAWLDGSGPLRVDATAQAVRAWVAVDPREFALPVRRGLAFLAAQQDTDGSLAYEPGSNDRNTWATLFADQAAAWAGTGVDPWGWL